MQISPPSFLLPFLLLWSFSSLFPPRDLWRLQLSTSCAIWWHCWQWRTTVLTFTVILQLRVTETILGMSSAHKNHLISFDRFLLHLFSAAIFFLGFLLDGREYNSGRDTFYDTIWLFCTWEPLVSMTNGSWWTQCTAIALVQWTSGLDRVSVYI